MFTKGNSEKPVRWTQDQELSYPHSGKDDFIYMGNRKVFEAQLKHRRALPSSDDPDQIPDAADAFERLQSWFDIGDYALSLSKARDMEKYLQGEQRPYRRPVDGDHKLGKIQEENRLAQRLESAWLSVQVRTDSCLAIAAELEIACEELSKLFGKLSNTYTAMAKNNILCARKRIDELRAAATECEPKLVDRIDRQFERSQKNQIKNGEVQ